MSDTHRPGHAVPESGPKRDAAMDDTAGVPAAAADRDPNSAPAPAPEPKPEPAPEPEPEAEPEPEPTALPVEPHPDTETDTAATTSIEPIGSPAWSDAPTSVLPAVPVAVTEVTPAAPPTMVEPAVPPTTEQPTPPAPPPPPLRAEGLGVTVNGRRVFAGFNAVLDPHSVLVVAAPSGTGRSTLLLTLTGRFAATSGRLEVAGATDRAQIRRITAVARIAGVVEPEPRLTVGEAIAERALIEGVSTAAGDAAVIQAAALLNLRLDRERLVEDLPAERRTLLAVALACSRPAELIVVDDLDDRLDIATQARVLDRLGALAAEGPAVVVTTTQPLRLPPWASGVTLLPLAVSVPAPDMSGSGRHEAGSEGGQR